MLVSLKLVLVAVASITLMRQCRKPAWWPGRLFARMMNVSHRRLTEWGLSHVALPTGAVILDVGCGGGRTVRALSERAGVARVYGIDYSAASVAVARRTNAAAIAAGTVMIQQGTVSSLPFAAASFDLVTAIETHYYWPDLVADLREVYRTLRSGGHVMIVAEAYRREHGLGIDSAVMRVLGARLLSAGEHRDALVAAGFAGVEIFEQHGKGWLCVVGTRAATDAA